MQNNAMPDAPTVYLGTGGYSDTDLLGHLYPKDSKKSDFLALYATNYAAVEVNSSFYAPIGHKAFAGMVEKSEGQLQFSIKLHQNFSHNRSATQEHALSFIQALSPIIEAGCLAPLLLQFPHGFDRTMAHRRYLATLCGWFFDYPLAIEFRHQSWHSPKVMDDFQAHGLIWCSVDYPKVSGLPRSCLIFTQRTGYLRLHGDNPNWWDAHSASERHDYCYTQDEMQRWAQTIANQRRHFDTLYVFFQNTTNGFAVANISMLRQALIEQGFVVK